MYSKIRGLMKQEIILGKKNIFTNINGITDEEAMRNVGKFLMHGTFLLLLWNVLVKVLSINDLDLY